MPVCSCHLPCAVEQGGSGKKAPQVEMGTQGKDEVDYNWLPASTLAAQSWCTLCTSLIISSPHMTPSSHHTLPSLPTTSSFIPSLCSLHPLIMPSSHSSHPLSSHPPLTPHMCHFMQGKAPNPPPAQGRERAANRRNVTCIRIANPSYCYFVTNNYCSHPTYIHMYACT